MAERNCIVIDVRAASSSSYMARPGWRRIRSPAGGFQRSDRAPVHGAVLFASARNLLVDRVDLVLAGDPFGKALFIGLPGDATRRLDLAPQPLSLAGDHAGVVCGQPAPLLPRDALELPPGACDAIQVHFSCGYGTSLPSASAQAVATSRFGSAVLPGIV